MICDVCNGDGFIGEKVCFGCDGFGLHMILITKIKQPETGSIVMTHCGICHRSEIFIHALAPKPERGDYWRLEGQCDNYRHVIAMSLEPKYHWGRVA